MKPGRNDPCPCGSEKKYKKCCQDRVGAPSDRQLIQHSAEPTVKHNPTKETKPTPAKMNLLIALYNAGHYVELERQANLLIQQYPDFGLAWKFLAASLHVQGKDPLPALQMATKFLSHDAESHYNLGFSLQGRKLFDDAVASYSRALKIKPDLVDAHFNLGNSLKDLGRLDDAVVSYRRALKIKPDYTDVHCNLGNVLKDLGQFDLAIASYLQALSLKPNDAELHYNLAIALKELGHLDKAVSSYRRALEIKPDYADAYFNLGNAQRDLTQSEAAAVCYRRALEIDPGYNDALLGLGDLYMTDGNMDGAEKLYQQVLANDAGNISARFCLAQVKKVEAGDENLVALEAAVLRSLQPGNQLPDKTAIKLHFALGKSYDDSKQYDKAFPHFLEGCRLKRATIEYDANKAAQNFELIMRTFDQKTLERLRGGGNMSSRPIFVLGMPRSGTTLTEQIIASHPDVYGAGELPDMLSIANRPVKGASYPQNMLAIDQSQLTAWAVDYISGLQKRAPDAQRITDKLPGNFIFIGLIHLMLPNAKIIHVNRNPVDNCVSCFTQLFQRQNEQTYNLSELGQYYVQYARLMEHWRSVLPTGAVLDVRYEDIVADKEAQARRILEYCGLEWNEASLDFHKLERPIRTASVTQVRQPIYTSSVERWRKYEKFLKPLLDELGGLVQYDGH